MCCINKTTSKSNAKKPWSWLSKNSQGMPFDIKSLTLDWFPLLSLPKITNPKCPRMRTVCGRDYLLLVVQVLCKKHSNNLPTRDLKHVLWFPTISAKSFPKEKIYKPSKCNLCHASMSCYCYVTMSWHITAQFHLQHPGRLRLWSQTLLIKWSTGV